MADVITTPNMNLPNPVPGVDPGIDYANNIASCFNVIDGHNHSPGSGVPIPATGLNLLTDLTFNDTNAYDLRSVRFDSQNTVLSQVTDIGCIYVVNGNLWYNNSAGGNVQITSGTSVLATLGTLSGGTAAASFSANVLIVNSVQSTGIPGNIQVASVLIGQQVIGSNFITLAPPSALAGGSYTLVLPSIPSVPSFLTLDTSGNITSSVPISGGITGTNIASGTITNNNLAPGLQMLTQNLGTVSGTGSVAMNVAVANAFYVADSASGTITVNISNFLDGQCATIMVQSNGNAVVVDFVPATGSVLFQNGVQPPQTTGLDIYTIVYNAITGNYYVNCAQDYT